MLRRTVRIALAVLVTATVTALPVRTADGVGGAAGSHAGPPYDFTTELVGQFTFVPLRDKGMITKTEHGYRYRTGGQNSHLVVTLVDRRLRFVDTGTMSWRKLSPACQRKHVTVGVAAECRVPRSITVRRPLLLEVWPRLGNDFTDTSALPATFAVAVLSDLGNDVAHFGAGWDYFNGFRGRDQVWGGGGNDFIRSGFGNDTVMGGPGNDDVVAGDDRDRVRGGDGDDRLWGGEGSDRLWGDDGADQLRCGTGTDGVHVDAGDHGFEDDCESVDHV